MAIDPVQHLPKYRSPVLGLEMSHAEVGEGDPILFLHGNPTSSYVWRNVMPHLQDRGRCLAPDLVGMGDSDKRTGKKPEELYTFAEHRRHLDAWLVAARVEGPITLVLHDWGSALGFDFARRNANKIKGIAYMEAIVAPLSWDAWPSEARTIFEALRGPSGEQMALRKNEFVEKILPALVLRELGPREMAEYRRPYLEAGESRRPTLAWPRELPLDGVPADVTEAVRAYGEFLSRSTIPKLFINADPGSILTGAAREFARSWNNQTEVTVRGSHFIQEDSPHEIGEALAAWYDGLA